MDSASGDGSSATGTMSVTNSADPHLMVLAPDQDVDTEELATTAAMLSELADEIVGLVRQLDEVDMGVAGAAARQSVGHHFFAFHGQLAQLRNGPEGLVALVGELESLAWHVRQVRYLYDDTEAVVTNLFTAPDLIAERLGLLAVSRFGEEPRPIELVTPFLSLGGLTSADAWLTFFHPRSQEALQGITAQSPYFQAAQDARGAARLAGSLMVLAAALVAGSDIPNGVIVRNNVDHLSGHLPSWRSPLADQTLTRLGLPAPGEEHNNVQATALTSVAWMHMLFGPARQLLGTVPRGGFEAVRSVPVNSRGERRLGSWQGIPLTENGIRGGTPLDTGPKVVPVGFGTEIEPLSTAEVLRRFETVNEHFDATDTGTIEIVNTTTADGERGWTVLIPGTKDWTVGTSQVMDMDTNMAGVAGEQTHMAMAVAQAMDQVGIQPGEPVSLFGHSQGGIVAAELSADPLLQSQYEISSVVTFGSPTAQVEIPENTAALHLIDSQDPVAGLDGARDPATGNRVTVAALSPFSFNLVRTHHLEPYVDVAGRLDDLNDPRLEHVHGEVERSFGAGQEVTSTRAYTFEVERF